jgi:hypothetical protein
MKKDKKKSAFQTGLSKDIKAYNDRNLPEEKRKSQRYAKLESIFTEIGDRNNRYIFYCPDIPFACSLVKSIYEHAFLLNKLGFNAQIVHEVKGYRPVWLRYDWGKDLKVHYLSEKTNKGDYTKPEFNFRPTDTIIVPDGFWSVMTGFAEVKTLHKVVMAFGYGGFATAEPGGNWASLGFTDVICMSEGIKEDYEKVWPELAYHVTGYSIDIEALSPLVKTEIEPTIALSCRSREDAQTIINLFYGRYPFLDMFQFKVLKKLDTATYHEQLKDSAVLIFSDTQAGHPAPPLEALAANVPVLCVEGRGMSHLHNQQGIMFVPNDNFIIAEALAEYCYNWLEDNIVTIEDKSILDNYTQTVVSNNLISTFSSLQERKIALFTAIKTAVDEGKLDEAVLDNMPTDFGDDVQVVEEPKLTIIK